VHVEVHCSVWHSAYVCMTSHMCIALWYSMVQCVAVCCSVLKCVAVRCSVRLNALVCVMRRFISAIRLIHV